MRYLLVFLVVLPLRVFASDPTPLIVLFVEVPLLILSLLFLAICFAAPKAGRVLMAILLVGSFVILAWAADVGYMSEGGGLLLLSMALEIAGIVIATRRIGRRTVKPDGPE